MIRAVPRFTMAAGTGRDHEAVKHVSGTLGLPARDFCAGLAAVGLVDDLDTMQRLVIVAEPNEVLRIYIQRVGDQRWHQAAPLAHGAEVVTPPPPERSTGYYDPGGRFG